MSRLMLLAATLATLLTEVPVHAADTVPADGKTCFCLEHQKSMQRLMGCKAVRGPQDFYATATCWDAERKRNGSPLSVTSEWAVIVDGQDRCTPCNPRPRPTRDVPRGEDQKAQP